MRNDRLSLDEIARHVDARSADYRALSDRIWGMPELAFEEQRSAKNRSLCWSARVFRITRNVGGMATAFIAEPARAAP
jgi:aminobenzoyl-glutamate utilization protein B